MDISDLIGTKSIIKESEIRIWTIIIHNTEYKITKKLRISKNVTDCYCQIDIRKDKKAMASGEFTV